MAVEAAPFEGEESDLMRHVRAALAAILSAAAVVAHSRCRRPGAASRSGAPAARAQPRGTRRADRVAHCRRRPGSGRAGRRTRRRPKRRALASTPATPSPASPTRSRARAATRGRWTRPPTRCWRPTCRRAPSSRPCSPARRAALIPPTTCGASMRCSAEWWRRSRTIR